MTDNDKPVAWQFYQDGAWHNGDDRIKGHRANTEEAGYPVRDLYAAPQNSDTVSEFEPDAICQEADGCPTEKAVLQRFWRRHIGNVSVPRAALIEVLRISDRQHFAWEEVKSALLAAQEQQ
jgi:hypothetical protein